VSGIPELVQHRHNGLLVEPDDACALADGIAALLPDKALGAQLGREARATVARNFDNRHNLHTVLQLLEPSFGHAAIAVRRAVA